MGATTRKCPWVAADRDPRIFGKPSAISESEKSGQAKMPRSRWDAAIALLAPTWEVQLPHESSVFCVLLHFEDSTLFFF